MFYPSCLHTHSQFCDGKATMAQMAEKAADFGFVSLGFSSHSPLPYENDWAMREEAYPAYFDTYAQIDRLTEYLNTYENLFCIGRNGQHRYNNMDHSMLSAMEAAKCVMTNSSDKTPVWNVNTEKAYHESK